MFPTFLQISLQNVPWTSAPIASEVLGYVWYPVMEGASWVMERAAQNVLEFVFNFRAKAKNSGSPSSPKDDHKIVRESKTKLPEIY